MKETVPYTVIKSGLIGDMMHHNLKNPRDVSEEPLPSARDSIKKGNMTIDRELIPSVPAPKPNQVMKLTINFMKDRLFAAKSRSPSKRGDISSPVSALRNRTVQGTPQYPISFTGPEKQVDTDDIKILRAL